MRSFVAAALIGLVALPAAIAQISPIGCADGTREGYVNVAEYPDIAACDAHWDIGGANSFSLTGASDTRCPGLTIRDTKTPACGRAAGNNGTNPEGLGCNVADVCAEGWHVCETEMEVHTASGKNGAAVCADASFPDKFYISRQSSNGCGVCALGTSLASACNSEACTAGCQQTSLTANDIFGCGGFVDPINFNLNGCNTLNRFTHNLCSSVLQLGFTCDDTSTAADNNGFCEAYTIKHVRTAEHPGGGGVLCCKGADDDLLIDNPYQCVNGRGCSHVTASDASNTVTISWGTAGNGRPCPP